MARLLDGKAVAKEIRIELKEKVAGFSHTPHLAVVQVGDNLASASYIRSKRRAAKRIGIESSFHHLPVDATQAEVLALVSQLNLDDDVDGILVQLPLPNQIDEDQILLAMDPTKDVDGFHPVSVGRLSLGMETFAPCTPAGIVELLQRSDIQLPGKNVCIVGRSNIVGRPLANLLTQKSDRGNATVTLCHSRTKNLPEFTKRADIVVAAIGRAGFLTAEHVREGQVIIDVGINHVDDPTTEKGYRIVGDVDFDAVDPIVEAITPVPRGIGPMTIAQLMVNVVQASQQRRA